MKQRVYMLVCRSSRKEVTRVEKFLNQVNKRLHLDDGTMYRMLISCTEAVNNAIIHGNKSDPERKVIVRCRASKKTITIHVKDEGKGFDHRNLPDPREEKNLLKESGRGVFLIRALMDNVKFRRLKHGSVVDMKIKLHN